MWEPVVSYCSLCHSYMFFSIWLQPWDCLASFHPRCQLKVKATSASISTCRRSMLSTLDLLPHVSVLFCFHLASSCIASFLSITGILFAELKWFVHYQLHWVKVFWSSISNWIYSIPFVDSWRELLHLEMLILKSHFILFSDVLQFCDIESSDF